MPKPLTLIQRIEKLLREHGELRIAEIAEKLWPAWRESNGLPSRAAIARLDIVMEKMEAVCAVNKTAILWDDGKVRDYKWRLAQKELPFDAPQ